ncbi:hypothetical protein [Lacinutrix himadriensis]|uniref:hypothetical protein n=1 Tax=Lacinutrix himadriensis TaxID=641549 RepID=UPI0006E23A2F|nr:hypothetical protein [Lacinutrix himadriensis]
MKKYFVIAVCILLAACDSDDSDNVSQNNAPSGTLISTETYSVISGYRHISTNSFDSNGRLIEINGIQTSPDGESSSSSTTFSYNSNGQIWKSIYTNGRFEEFYFTNNLISSSIYANEFNSGERIYSYNNLNQLNHIQFIDEDNVEVATKDITFDSNGNITNTYSSNSENTSFTEYTFEYDNKNNPAASLFNNQEFRKILEYNFNNKTKRIYSRNSGTNVFTMEYTYNEADYPLTSNEYMDGDLVTQSTFNYQE